MTVRTRGEGVKAKIKVLLMVVAAIAVARSVNASAIEPPDMKRITDDDKIYFGARLDKEQFDKLQRVIGHVKMSRQPCSKSVEITRTLGFLKEITPIFKEAATNADISPYARKYSQSLARELIGTSKALNEILPHYRKACAAAEEAASRPGPENR